MGTRRHSFLRGHESLRHVHAIPVALRRNLGLRSSLLHPSKRRRRRHLARLTGQHHAIPTTNAGRLRPRLHQAITSAAYASAPHAFAPGPGGLPPLQLLNLELFDLFSVPSVLSARSVLKLFLRLKV